MANTRAEAFAPATVANLGVGFDILGLAVEGAGDTVIVERRAEKGAIMVKIEGDDGRLPLEANKNVASISANAMLKALKADFGVEITLHKGLPLASGLGSSAASSVAAVVALNAMLDNPYTPKQLLPFALEGEAAVSGYHADNAAPCLLGGIILANGIDVQNIFSLPVPDNLWLSLVTPDVAVPTAEARAALPREIPLGQMVRQTGAVAALVHALHTSNIPLLARVIEADTVITPARAYLMPYIEEVTAAAKKAGALGVFIGGAGPTLCAISDSEATAIAVTNAMNSTYDNAGIAGREYTCCVLAEGASVISVG